MPANDDEMPAEIDFKQGTRGKFFRADAKVHPPVYLDQEVLAWLAALAAKKGCRSRRSPMRCSGKTSN